MTRHGFEEIKQLAHKRATRVRLVIARARYKTVHADGDTDIIRTPMPSEMLRSAMAAPSLGANFIMENVGKGTPFFRLEESFTRDGISIDRDTLSPWKHHVGATLKTAVVRAMRGHALATAFRVSTEGTGVCVQPTAALYSVIASARLQRLDPEEYLRCVIRLVPIWPDDRMNELAPMFWTRTRERLDDGGLAAELGPITIPDEPLDTSATPEEKTATD